MTDNDDDVFVSCVSVVVVSVFFRCVRCFLFCCVECFMFVSVLFAVGFDRFVVSGWPYFAFFVFWVFS